MPVFSTAMEDTDDRLNFKLTTYFGERIVINHSLIVEIATRIWVSFVVGAVLIFFVLMIDDELSAAAVLYLFHVLFEELCLLACDYSKSDLLQYNREISNADLLLEKLQVIFRRRCGSSSEGSNPTILR